MGYKRLTERNDKGEAIYKTKTNADSIVENFKIHAIREGEVLDRLAELEDKMECGELVEVKSCVWEEWEDDALGSVWNCSNCKEDFCFLEGGVNENNYGYCPHCGAKIVALKELKGEV